MNTPSPEGRGFSARLRGNPHASRPMAGSRPPELLQHVAGRVDVAVKDEVATVAAVHPVRERLRPVGRMPASAASPGGAARIDQDHGPTGAFSLASQHVPQLRPRGIVNRPGEHRALQRVHVQVFHRNHAMPGRQAVGEHVQEVPPPRGDACVVAGEVPACHSAPLRSPFLPGQAGRHCKGRAFTCCLKATVPCAKSHGS